MEYRNILVPLDGSLLAEHAIPVAVRLAKRAGGRLHVLAVVPAASFMQPEDLPAVVNEGTRRAHERLTAYLADVGDRLHAAGFTAVHTEIRIGSPVEEILIATARHHCDMIVMTSHGRGGMERAWLGSTADALIRRSIVPLLILKPEDGAEADFAPRRRFDTVLLPLDGSAVAEMALEPAVELARLNDATLTLLQVVTTPLIAIDAPPGMDLDHIELVDRRQRAEIYLGRVAATLRAEGVEAATIVVDADTVPDAILDLARNGSGDVIAIATHGLGGIKRLLLGSVADKVMRGADRPVLVVPPATDGARGPALFGVGELEAKA